MKNDPQQYRVYAWERQIIAPLDKTMVSFHQIKPIVEYVWNNEGLYYPPKVEFLPKNSHNMGDATRLTVRFRYSGVPTWVILHEMAHAMTTDIDHNSNLHGAIFVGVYVNLLVQYIPNLFTRQMLYQSLDSAGVVFVENVAPMVGK